MSDYHLDITLPRAAKARAGYAARSEAMAIPADAVLDVAYGDDPRQRYDLFPAGKNAPVLVFFHGGYWRAGDKESRRFPAEAWGAKGVAWATVEYRLSPAVSLEEIVSDARSAVRHIRANAARYDVDPARIHITGNSAGGHLAAMAAATEPCASLSAMSGLYDMIPMQNTECQDWLALTETLARALSPVHTLPPPDCPVVLTHGSDEPDGFPWQSNRFAAALTDRGNRVEVIEVPGVEHFEIVAEYARPEGAFFKALKGLVMNET